MEQLHDIILPSIQRIYLQFILSVVWQLTIVIIIIGVMVYYTISMYRRYRKK